MNLVSIANFSGKLSHAVKVELHALSDIVRNGLPDVMLQFGGGIGDELLLTTVAHELKLRTSRLKIWQVSHSAELLDCNPDYHRVFTKEHWPLRYALFLEKVRLRLAYAQEIVPRKSERPPNIHILAELCRKAGIQGRASLRPYFYFRKGEKENGRISENQITIQCCAADGYTTVMRNKLWFKGRLQSVVAKLKAYFGKHIEIIQLGSSKDPLLNSAIDLRGKTSLRQTAAILANSRCFIGTVGFLMHLARSVECRSVIIYGGREHSSQTGYVCNENLNSFIDCSPCWLWDDCDYQRKCMEIITVDDVFTAVIRAYALFGKSLETEVLCL